MALLALAHRSVFRSLRRDHLQRQRRRRSSTTSTATSAVRSWKQKAWFFTSWRLNDKYAYITGLGDEVAALEAQNKYTFKGTFQVGKNNQIIGYLNKREKLQDKRGINLTTPLSAAYYQSSRNYPWKAEWTSVLGSRAFLDVLYGNWYNFFPLRPVRDFGLYDGPWTPPRQDTATSIWSNTGGNNGYQDQKRYKPQFYTTLSYFKDGWKGSHDLRTGFDWKRDRRSLFNDQPFDIWYRDNNIGGVPTRCPGRHLQLVGHRHQRRRLHRRLDQRHVEGHATA